MRKKTKKGRIPIQNLVLRSLAGVGVIGIALMVPKAARFLKKLDRPAQNRQQLYRRISQALARLEAAGLVRVSGAWGKRRVELTEKGKEVIDLMEDAQYEIPEPAFWDGKWRVLMFDIPESRRRTRDQLRTLLRNADFVRIQDSIWVHPYPCDDFVSLIRAHVRSGVGELRMLVAEALESDKSLREHFQL